MSSSASTCLPCGPTLPTRRKLSIVPTAGTSSKLARLLSYPANLLQMEVYSGRLNDGKPPPGRCNDDMSSAPAGQLSAGVVAVTHQWFEGRPCPSCPKDRNMFTMIIGHAKKTNNQVRSCSLHVAVA
eukprot:COSAG02_NODE_22455_length_752_cov_0.941807_1_plen_126_part_01